MALAEQRTATGEPAGLTGVLEYAADLFDRGTVEALGQRLMRLLTSAVADATRPLGSLAILDADERGTILEGFNATGAGGCAPSATLPSLFAAQAAAHAGRRRGGVRGPRAELRGARRPRQPPGQSPARSLGVGPETVVGLCVERSPEMVVGLLGILKAGAAYLPLDPNYPRERLAFMLTDAGARLLVTQQALLARLPEAQPRRTVTWCGSTPTGRRSRGSPRPRPPSPSTRATRPT